MRRRSHRERFSGGVWLALLAIIFVNMLPLLLYKIGGDIDFQFSMIRCFAGQFWQGDVYPRWCMSANAGLGAPLFVLYFPLPFYVASLIYPIVFLPFGLTVEHVYLLSVGLAAFLSAAACFAWLRDIVTPQRALLATAAFLLMPYRSEIMMYRAGYSELWCFVFIPLIFKYTRQLARGERAILPLTFSVALALLSHVPTTATALFGAGLYIMVMSGGDIAAKVRFAVAVLWAGMLTAFYTVPAAFYTQFLQTKSKIAQEAGGGGRVWSNDYLGVDTLIVFGQWLLVSVIITTILAMLVFVVVCKRRRKRATDAFIRQEIYMWAMLFVVGFFMLVPLSAPIYKLLGPLNSVLFPWRMQALFAMSGTYLLAVWMEYLLSKNGKKTGGADYGLLLALLYLVSFLIGSQRAIDKSPRGQQLSSANYIIMPEYRTLWTTPAFYNIYYILTLHREKAEGKTHMLDIKYGSGTAELDDMRWNAITIKTHSEDPMIVHLLHNYFPSWSAKLETGKFVGLYPQAGSGQMLMEVPEGEHTITINNSMAVPNNLVGNGSKLLSIVAAFIFSIGLLRRYRMRA